MSSIPQPLTQKHKLSVKDYHSMGEAGIFHENERVELINGEVFDMAPIGSNHAGKVNLIGNLLKLSVGTEAIVSIRNLVTLDPQSEPEPDIALLNPRADFYCRAHPGPKDILLLIEIADSSLPYDREIKLPLYSGHRIPEVWLVDLENQQLIVHQNPATDGYQNIRPAKDLGSLSPTQLSTATVNLELLFQDL